VQLPRQKSLDFVILGTARSGTTALGSAVNLDPQTFCAIEYFKGELELDYSKLTLPQDFFCDKYAASNPINTQQTREILKKKLNDGPVNIYGNKVPNYYLTIRRLHHQLPQLRSVALIRDPVQVALSWDKRAANDKDSWDSGRTGIVAILNWALEILAYSEGINNLLLVSYDALFFDDPSYFSLIMQHLTTSRAQSPTTEQFSSKFFRLHGDESRSIHDNSFYIHHEFCIKQGCDEVVKLIRDKGIVSCSDSEDCLRHFAMNLIPQLAVYICNFLKSSTNQEEVDFICKWMNQYVRSYDDKCSLAYQSAIPCFRDILATISTLGHKETPSYARLVNTLSFDQSLV